VYRAGIGLTGIKVRADLAMTGEITLRGKVLPIGGLKEKLLAAHRGGIQTVLIPAENEKDLAEIPSNVTDKLEIHPVAWIDDVLEFALTEMPTPRDGHVGLDLTVKGSVEPGSEGEGGQIRPH